MPGLVPINDRALESRRPQAWQHGHVRAEPYILRPFDCLGIFFLSCGNVHGFDPRLFELVYSWRFRGIFFSRQVARRKPKKGHVISFRCPRIFIIFELVENRQSLKST